MRTVLVLSNINQAPSFEWIAASRLAKQCGLSFVLLNSGDTRMEQRLRELGVPVRRITYTGKRDLPRATWELTRHLHQLKPEIVHTHLMDASLAGLTAARLVGIRRRIHTRHHSNLHHEHYPHAVYYDKWVNRLSTEIVATCENVKHVLTQLDGARADKIRVLHFGFDLGVFEGVSEERVALLRERYRLNQRGPIIGVIARYMEYKGLQHVIPAFERVLARHPDACLLMANTSGKEYAAQVKRLLSRLPGQSYREVPFESDFAALYRLFDVFVHAPIDEVSEAFGQVYVEALAARRPSVFTISGVAREFIRDGHNARVVPHGSPEAIAQAVIALLGDPTSARKLAEQGHADVGRLFPLESMIQKLEELYSA